MDEKEKYYAEIETRLEKMNATLQEIKLLRERKKESLPDVDIHGTLEKHEKAREKLSELKKADESSWRTFKDELDKLADDIDEETRSAWAYVPH